MVPGRQAIAYEPGLGNYMYTHHDAMRACGLFGDMRSAKVNVKANCGFA